MKTVIGIISYLPDDSSIREHRLKTLKKLIDSCNSLFNIDILIVLQNYNDEEINQLKSKRNVTVSDNYDKLGITGARKKLRELFLASKYDNLVMLDDDCTVFGDRDSANNYLKQIEDNPNKFYLFNSSLLKLFAISKTIFSQVDFDDVSPELEEGFEDRIFVDKLKKLFPENAYTFMKGRLDEYSISTADPYSTWYKNQDIDLMLKRTKDKISKN